MERTRKRDRIKIWVRAGLRRLSKALEHTWPNRQTHRHTQASSSPHHSPPAPATTDSFLDAQTTNLSMWRQLAFRLKDLGTHTTGTLHAGLIRTELDLATRLETMTLPPRLGAELALWKQFREATSTLWNGLNVRLIQTWQDIMGQVHQVWTTTGEQQANVPWKSALTHCSQAVNKTWMEGWNALQSLLDELGHQTGTGFSALIQSTLPGTSQPPHAVFSRIQAELESAFRRAQGDLWGVWSTQGALMRDSTRKAIENNGSILDIYNNIFNKIDENLCAALEHVSLDLSTTWAGILAILSQNLREGGVEPVDV